MARFHLPPANWQAAALTGDEARHLSQVLRGKAGDVITVFDGHGRRASAKVLQVSRDRVSLELSEVVSPAPPQPRITLAQAIPKGKNMDWIVQKAVELGVSRIQPLVTRHTIVSPGGDKAEKWRRTALEACKQCGQFTIPIIEDPLPFTEWLANRPSADLEIIASLADNPRNFRETLNPIL
jgi:16S rRNA (uracil1498-N3)-methyltransferase